MTEPAAVDVLDGADGSLLELVDHLLNQGVVLTGEVVLGLAGVDLIYLRLSLLLCAADRLLEPSPPAPIGANRTFPPTREGASPSPSQETGPPAPLPASATHPRERGDKR